MTLRFSREEIQQAATQLDAANDALSRALYADPFELSAVERAIEEGSMPERMTMDIWGRVIEANLHTAVPLLVQAGLSLHHPRQGEPSSQLPLARAIQATHPRPEVVRAMLRAGGSLEDGLPWRLSEDLGDTRASFPPAAGLSGNTPLGLAICSPRASAQVVEVLLGEGASPTASPGQNPMSAVQAGRLGGLSLIECSLPTPDKLSLMLRTKARDLIPSDSLWLSMLHANANRPSIHRAMEILIEEGLAPSPRGIHQFLVDSAISRRRSMLEAALQAGFRLDRVHVEESPPPLFDLATPASCKQLLETILYPSIIVDLSHPDMRAHPAIAVPFWKYLVDALPDDAVAWPGQSAQMVVETLIKRGLDTETLFEGLTFAEYLLSSVRWEEGSRMPSSQHASLLRGLLASTYDFPLLGAIGYTKQQVSDMFEGHAPAKRSSLLSHIHKEIERIRMERLMPTAPSVPRNRM